jgi:hypothetical protein
MDHCLYCQHPLVGHWGSGCHRSSFLRGDCLCTFVDLEEEQGPAGSTRRLGLEDITIEGMRRLPAGTVGAFEDLFYGADPSEQRLVRRRLEVEFNGMAPTDRREVLEAGDAREFLENVGIVSRWSIGPIERQ